MLRFHRKLLLAGPTVHQLLCSTFAIHRLTGGAQHLRVRNFTCGGARNIFT